MNEQQIAERNMIDIEHEPDVEFGDAEWEIQCSEALGIVPGTHRKAETKGMEET